MKEVTIKIPDKKYLAFIKYIKSKFTDIQIEEKNKKYNELTGDDDTYDNMLLSGKSLAEDWLSNEDNRWDEVL